jgi:hypothetical protein
MDYHALAVLAEAESWDWPHLYRTQESGEQGGKYLYGAHREATRLLHSRVKGISQQHICGAVLV